MMMQQPPRMQRMPFPFIGPTGGYFGQQFDPQQTINMMTVSLGENIPPALVSIAGTKTIYTKDSGNSTRGLFATGNKLIGVFEDEVVLFDENLVPLTLGALNTSAGIVNFAANNAGQVMLVDGVDGWVVNLSAETLTQITNAAFTAINNPVDCDYLDGHIFVVFGSGNQFLISDLENAASFDALNSARLTSSGNQKLTGVRVISGRIFIFGETVTELWYPTGQASSFPFARDNNSVLQFGCASNATITAGNIQVKSMYRIFPEVESVVAWLARNKNGTPKILVAMDGDISIISDDATEYKLQNLTNLSDAVGFIYSVNGHTFYLITFPTDNLTLVYDFDMKVWHEQQMLNGDRYFASCYVRFQDKSYLGHLSAAKLSELSEEYVGNDDEAIHCVRTSAIFALPSYERAGINRFQLNMRAGTGYKTTEPVTNTKYNAFNLDPKLYLSHSVDGGYHFSQQRETTVGRVGEAEWQAVWLDFPISQRHVFRVESFNKVKTIWVSAHVQLENLGV